ncbi:SpoIIE family protein phosphatase [Streptomyces sp. MMS24-I2-30]|uniref:SpoIIE family protein phosphatase n=1 Tax=Streptomyces sp. MMS24-I2-30 TaxID=3351564 RepID=UPI003896DA1E
MIIDSCPVTAGADASPARDAFLIAKQLVDSAVPAMADVAAVEVSDVTLDECTAMLQPCDGNGFRRAAFHSVFDPQGAYRIGHASHIRTGTPHRYSLRDMRPRVVPHVGPQARWLSCDPARAARMRKNGVHSLMVVPLAFRHVVLGLAAFYRCDGSSPFGRADLRAATQLARKTARALDAVRRDLREQGMGRRLQHALISQPPHLTAVEDVNGHVPENGAPGGWFDVISLPSARVGLVAGHCGGHGITAAAAMSQQKARIRALAALDIDPAEVLSRSFGPSADEPVRSATHECAEGTPSSSEETHCVYAVYDPVTHRCTAARTGAACVTVIDVHGDIRSAIPTAPAPIGAASCDVSEFEAPPDSFLLLSSAAAQERHRNAPANRAVPDGGGQAADSHRPAQRVTPPVVLTVRTQAIAPTDVVTWDLPNDAPSVADARARTTAQLTSWDLLDLSFTAALVVSELVTNAIRYSTGPIRLRLIRDHALICEVSDTSHAAPHAHEPAPSEQSGRGLSIVAHLTQAYGTRYTATGKIVWTELDLCS